MLTQRSIFIASCSRLIRSNFSWVVSNNYSKKQIIFNTAWSKNIVLPRFVDVGESYFQKVCSQIWTVKRGRNLEFVKFQERFKARFYKEHMCTLLKVSWFFCTKLRYDETFFWIILLKARWGISRKFFYAGEDHVTCPIS